MKWRPLVAILSSARAITVYSRPFSQAIQARQEYGSQANNASATIVDLGYAIYEGVANATTNINAFRGIRYAEASRWQAPHAPALNRSDILPATDFGPTCPQNLPNTGHLYETNLTGVPEHCLFLNVWSPSNVTGPLPVFVWIHGGGYGGGSAQEDMSPIVNTNEIQFVAVNIQYRLGALGFASSDELYRKGVVNAGLLDQHFALHWVQEYIHLFNGDPSRVTIAGESAGAGSVMLQDMAYGGSLGTQLFTQSFAASPYLPMQYGYKDWIPSQAYYSLAAQLGCDSMKAYGANGTRPTFECMLDASSDAIINASATISQSGAYGTWAFLPVTDGSFLQDLPSRQLARGKVNGINALVGNNANEGWGFTPQTIVTEEDLIAWLRLTFPIFSENDIAKVLLYYPSSNAPVDPSAPLFATSGDSGPTALNQSSAGTGQQQRANNIYAETTFVCPSYWLTEAYSSKPQLPEGKAYKYQFSSLPAFHADDARLYMSPPDNPPPQRPYTYDLSLAFHRIIGNFITLGNPSIPSDIANGALFSLLAKTTLIGSTLDENPASEWPAYTIAEPWQIDLNTTCGTKIPYPGMPKAYYCAGPGTFNDFRKVDAYSWEGGRGMRCDFWRAMGELVPE